MTPPQVADGAMVDEPRRQGAAGSGVELFELLVASVVDYAIFALDPQGRVASWNPGAERLKGYRAEEIVGEHFSRFYTAEDLSAGKPERELAVAAAEGSVEDEGFRVRKDGSLFWANVVITAVRDTDGTLRGFAKVTRDLTARKQAEDNLRASEAAARAAADELRRLDGMKNEFVAMVAHDLSSPLSVVAGFVGLLLDQWDDTPDDDKREMLRRVNRTASHLVGLVTDILAVGRIEAGELEMEPAPFDVGALVEQAALESTPPGAEWRITVSTPAAPPLAVGDERRTWQVVMNLLSNAVKFSPPDSAIEVDVCAEGQELVVSVADQGTGVAPEDRERVFERFVRLAQPRGDARAGSGLGLYISKGLVEAQGGRIWVDSEPGRGATFRFTLPAAATGEDRDR